MSLNLNKVVLAGRLTADPELKTTQSGVSVTTFTVAVNRRFQREGAEQQADFITCVAWRQTAEFITKYFTKGSSICVTGSIQTRKWQDQNGQNRYGTDVVVDEAMFVESKGGSETRENGAKTDEKSEAVRNSLPTVFTPAQLEEASRAAEHSKQKFESVAGEDGLPF